MNYKTCKFDKKIKTQSMKLSFFIYILYIDGFCQRINNRINASTRVSLPPFMYGYEVFNP